PCPCIAGYATDEQMKRSTLRHASLQPGERSDRRYRLLQDFRQVRFIVRLGGVRAPRAGTPGGCGRRLFAGERVRRLWRRDHRRSAGRLATAHRAARAAATPGAPLRIFRRPSRRAGPAAAPGVGRARARGSERDQGGRLGMARPIWSGSVSFGLVSVPVKLFSATSPKEVRFHMLHDKDGGRIRQKRVCSIDGEEVTWEHIVKGFEISKGRYVTVTREELEAFNPRANKAIEIEDFVDLAQIDPIYYESTYYLVPDRGAAKPYALLVEAMKRTHKVGIARFVLRTKQYLAAVRPLEHALAISTMLYADEVVSQDELEALPDAHTKPGERELKMAEQLIGSLAADFDIRKYKDD